MAISMIAEMADDSNGALTEEEAYIRDAQYSAKVTYLQTRGHIPPDSYLASVMHNARADWRRRQAAKKRDADTVSLEEMHEELPEPADFLVDIMAVDELEAALARMTARQRRIWELRREGYSYSEIGRRLDCSAENARRIAERGAEVIRPQL